MKLCNISRLALALVAILMATSAHANVDFRINDFNLMEAELGAEITVPIMARFNTPVDIWEVNLTFPEGLVPIDVIKGEYMYFGILDQNGQSEECYTGLLPNDDFTHIIGSTFGSIEYGPTVNDEGEIVYEPYGSAKWSGYSYNIYYNYMFSVKCYVDYNFTGGEIQISGNASCGYDTRYNTSNFMPDPAIVGFTQQADTNGDGVIDISDASYLLNYLSGNGTIYYGGDVHQDGIINLLDYEELMDYLIFDQWFTGHQLYISQPSSAYVGLYFPPVNDPTEVLFYVDNLEFTADDLGRDITIPVKARFGNYISSWDVQFIFPEGLTPVYATRGSDMTINYYDDMGQEKSGNTYLIHDESFTRFICSPMIDMGYQPSADGDTFEPYGSVKWSAGEYDEMFLITCSVSSDFTGGEIEILTNASSGFDTRNDLMQFEPINNDVHDGNGYMYVPGDINLDGTVNVSDVTSLLYYLINPSSSDYYGNGDTNRDGDINIVDVDALFDFLLNGQWYAGYVLSHGETQATVTVPVPDYAGDVNGDGYITITDVTMLIDMLLTQDYIEYSEFIDVNGDGEISISDVTALIDKLLRQ